MDLNASKFNFEFNRLLWCPSQWFLFLSLASIFFNVFVFFSTIGRSLLAIAARTYVEAASYLAAIAMAEQQRSDQSAATVKKLARSLNFAYFYCPLLWPAIQWNPVVRRFLGHNFNHFFFSFFFFFFSLVLLPLTSLDQLPCYSYTYGAVM